MRISIVSEKWTRGCVSAFLCFEKEDHSLPPTPSFFYCWRSCVVFSDVNLNKCNLFGEENWRQFKGASASNDAWKLTICKLFWLLNFLKLQYEPSYSLCSHLVLHVCMCSTVPPPAIWNSTFSGFEFKMYSLGGYLRRIFILFIMSVRRFTVIVLKFFLGIPIARFV